MKALFIVGPSGSGKTTLSESIRVTYRQTFGLQSVTLVSLDPANFLSQNKDIEINELVTVEDIMQQFQIGPNGAIMYAMDFLLQNIEWLLQKIKKKIEIVQQKNAKTKYHNHLFIFDLPGQIQLYINKDSVRRIIQQITNLISNESGTSPCLLQLFDCTYMHNVNQFISICMMSLATMINMEMPHINILNKIDIIKSAQNKPSRGVLDEYFKLHSASELVKDLKPIQDQQKQTNSDIIAKVIDTYGQVSFMPCSIYKIDLLYLLIYQIERIFGTLQVSLCQKSFAQLVKQVDQYSIQRAITSLQNQLYEQEQENLQNFERDIKEEEKN